MRAPGPQDPGKYPHTGANYSKYGEQPGWVYNPWDDKYYPDPKAREQYYIEQGLIDEPPKPPDLVDTLVPVAATAGTISATQALGPELVEGVSSLISGGGAETVAETALTEAAAASGAQGASSIANAGALAAENAAFDSLASGVTGEAAGSSMLGGALSNFGSMGIGPQAGIVGGLILGAKGVHDLLEGSETEGIDDWLARGTIGIATGGLSELARLTGLFGHESTQDRQRRRWGSLSKDFDPQSHTGGYISNYQKHIDDPYNPEYWSATSRQEWEAQGRPDPKEFRKARQKDLDEMTAMEVTPGLGFFRTFGDQWLEGFTEEQRVNIAQQALDEDLVYSSGGDLKISDEDRLREIGDAQLNAGMLNSLETP